MAANIMRERMRGHPASQRQPRLVVEAIVNPAVNPGDPRRLRQTVQPLRVAGKLVSQDRHRRAIAAPVMQE